MIFVVPYSIIALGHRAIPIAFKYSETRLQRQIIIYYGNRIAFSRRKHTYSTVRATNRAYWGHCLDEPVYGEYDVGKFK
jgi:hypothetical protein